MNITQMFFRYKSVSNYKRARLIFMWSISYDTFVHWNNMTACNLMHRPGTSVCLCVSVSSTAVKFTTRIQTHKDCSHVYDSRFHRDDSVQFK
jgi:hypothetical protein